MLLKPTVFHVNVNILKMLMKIFNFENIFHFHSSSEYKCKVTDSFTHYSLFHIQLNTEFVTQH